MFWKRRKPLPLGGVLLAAAIHACAASGHLNPEPGGSSDWPDYLGGPQSSQYSDLDQIDRSNVQTIAVAWSYQFSGNGQSIGNPLVIDGRMFAPWSGGIVCLEAATGRELWHRDAPGMRMRGLSSWASPDGKSRRIFYNHRDRLYAADAASGELIEDFGDVGSIDLKVGLGRDPTTIKRIESQTPGRVFENLIIVGSAGGGEWNGPPGYIRAYDVRSGRLVWTFHTIPQPGEPNYDSWPKDAWNTVGGVNNWSEMTVDPKNGILFVPLASAQYEFYGGNRPGNNLYADCLVALDARSGRRLWHFQTVHHDLWDYDLPQAPKLLTLQRDGKRVEAVAIATKAGYVFTFDRRTGRPVFPIEERPVPQTDVDGERTSPTQPFPVAPAPFARQSFTAEDLSPYLDEPERKAWRTLLAGMRNEGPFTPPSLRGSIQMPGSSGGSNWGNGAVDPRSGRLFIVSVETPSILHLERPSARTNANFLTANSPPGAKIYAENCASCHGEERKGQPPLIPPLVDVAQRLSTDQARDVITRGRKIMPGFDLPVQSMTDLLAYLGFQASAALAEPANSAASAAKPATSSPIKYKSGYNFVFSKASLPANTPPWSTLTAYDMNQGKLLWQVPFGELPAMKGSGSVFPRGTIVTTAGGLVIAATQDRMLRAWDMDSGKLLLATQLPSNPGGIPAVYMSGGRQFIAVPVASYDPAIARMVSSSVMPEGRNSLVAFALPANPNSNR
jgi:quinoprotein glucose dehydrogenase